MKKFLCGALVCVMPLALLAGCTGVEFLTKSQTGQNASNFTYSISQNLMEFQENIAQKIADNTGLSADETVFDFSALATDDGAQEIYHNTVWDLVKKTNAENLFALSAYHIFEMDYDNNYYDISFLADVESDVLKSFFIKKAGTNGAKTVFLGKLSGLEDASLNLPLPVASNQSLVDPADDVIKQLGNNIKFEVWRTDIATNITIDTAFTMPTQAEVLATIGTQDIIPYFEDENTIMLVYTANDETYSKEIVFEADEDGVIQKKVSRFVGDKHADPSITSSNDYTYSLELPADAPYNILGTYSVSFSAGEGGIYCLHNPQGEDLSFISEYYLVKSGEIVGRIKQSATAGVISATTVDLLIENNLSQGKIKYAFQKLGTPASTLRNESVLTKNFCDITEAEYALAQQTTSLNVEIVAFDITETKFGVVRAQPKG